MVLFSGKGPNYFYVSNLFSNGFSYLLSFLLLTFCQSFKAILPVAMSFIFYPYVVLVLSGIAAGNCFQEPLSHKLCMTFAYCLKNSH